MRKIAMLFCANIVLILHAQIPYIIPGSSSIAQTSVADTRTWSAFDNVANMGNLQNSEIGLSYANRFVISELSTKSFQAAFKSDLINTGVSFSHFGYSLYNEMLFGLGFARNFSNHFSLGVQFNYYTAYFSASNTYHGTLFPQVGLNIHLSQDLSIGFQTFNPFQSKIKTDFVTKKVPSMFSIGTEYFFSPELVWRTQIDREIQSNYRFATGFEYSMLEFLKVKLGAYGFDYLIPCLGVGSKFGNLTFDLNGEMHPLLGLNTIIFLKYRFGN